MWKPQKAPQRVYKKKVFENVLAVSDFIYQIGESDDLRRPSEEVTLEEISTADFQKQIAYLKSCMLEYRKRTGVGRGITGVQIGIRKKIAVIFMPRHSGKQRLYQNPDSGQARMTEQNDMLIIINPIITKQSHERLTYPEMCMSAAPLIAPVIRPAWIEFSYIDEHREKQCWNTKADTTEGRLYNRVFQHEIDHMHGIINIDRVQSKELIFESDKVFYEKAKFEKV